MRLDKPTPELKPEPGFFTSQKWSPNLTKRMRYLELPWWDSTRQTLAPIPKLPDLVVSRVAGNEILERVPLKHYDCQFDYFFGEYAETVDPEIECGDELQFSVTYDSGGLFNPILSLIHI